jgi:hypothetical protein
VWEKAVCFVRASCGSKLAATSSTIFTGFFVVRNSLQRKYIHRYFDYKSPILQIKKNIDLHLERFFGNLWDFYLNARNLERFFGTVVKKKTLTSN